MTATRPLPRPAHPRPADVAVLGLIGIAGRKLRAALSAAGIAIGIAAMVAVLGIGAASRAGLIDEIQRLGTNMLTAQPGQSLLGGTASLPTSAVPLASRVAGVRSVSSVGIVPGATVRRTDRIPPEDSGGIAVDATRLDLLRTLDGRVASGVFLNAATARYPVTVLGAVAAGRLGIDRPGEQVYIGGRWFTVIGILEPLTLAPEIDRAALIGPEFAASAMDWQGHPTTVYIRADDAAVQRVSDLLAATVDPQNPQDVQVSRPSDALAAELAAKSAFNGLFLGLGAVALLVGGVGVANIMVISVLERSQEIGLRRALGATNGQIRLQFLTEAIALSAFGGVGGVLLGMAITAGYAAQRGWPFVLPSTALVGGIAASLLIGALAGLYPARRASRLDPTEALATG